MREADLTTTDGRVLHAYDVGPHRPVWMNWSFCGTAGTPNIGAPPEPLSEVARSLRCGGSAMTDQLMEAPAS
mgnify:CR=1 FL=1